MKPLSAYLCVLSAATSGVIIVGSWCAIESRPQSRYTGSRSEARLHGVRRALDSAELGSLLNPSLGLALSSSGGSDPVRVPQRHSTVRAQSVRSVPRAGALGSLLTIADPPSGLSLATIASSASHLCGVPEPILFALISRESGWRQYDKAGRTLRSRSNALGLTQIKASTARGEVSPTLDLSTPFGNTVAGACYLRKMYDRFGDWGTALKAYRIGPNAKELHTSKTAAEYSADIMERSSN